MKIQRKEEQLDTILLPTEWRYSAAIVGLIRYFEFRNEEFERMNYEEIDYEGWNGIAYSSSWIREDRFLKFAESFYGQEFWHLKAEKMLQSDEWTAEQIKTINGFLTGNTVLKKIFEKNKFDGENKDQILGLLNTNRLEIIKETFRYKPELYRKFCNTNLLFTKENPHCRLLGYNIDENRKSKETSFIFDANKILTNDMIEFDFIPFAFTNTRLGFFVNNNYNIRSLRKTNQNFKEILEEQKEEKESAKMTLLRHLIQSSSFLDYDVEIIVKSQDYDYYETLFIRENARRNIMNLKDPKIFNVPYKLGENYWMNLEEELFDRCMNYMILDDLIETLLKIRIRENIQYIDFIVSHLVDINVEWKEDIMDRGELHNQIEQARKAGYHTAKKLKEKKLENKITSYRQKLTSAVVFHDYDRVNEILLQLESYAGMDYSFVYDLFEDGEKNKDITFAFISALNPEIKENKATNEEGGI